MKLINLSCPNCGSQLQIDADNKQAKCDFCGNLLLIDDGIQHIQYDNAENAGYEFEKGRQRAQAEQRQRVQAEQRQRTTQNSSIKYWEQPQNRTQKKGNYTWLWVIGWIFFFPVPLTLLLLNNQKMSKKLKYGIIGTVWVVVLVWGLIYGAADKNEQSAVEKNSVSEQESEASEPITETVQKEDAQEEQASTEKSEDKKSPDEIIESFVQKFNSTSDTDLIFVEDFTPSDRNSSHYRVEFRLNAYSEAMGKSYAFDNVTVDLVARTTIFHENIIRVYMDDASLKQCEDMVTYASPIMDEDITKSEINEAITFINEGKFNSCYYADLGLGCLKKGDDSYEFMLKLSND